MAKGKEGDSIAGRLRSAREMAGLSQGQVAEIEAGRRKVSADELRRLGEVYEVDIAWLAGTQSLNATSRVELAARELAKLKESDLDRVLQLLQSLRRDKEGSKR
jgi:transcriptional regulator with XRE-family HTH domain